MLQITTIRFDFVNNLVICMSWRYHTVLLCLQQILNVSTFTSARYWRGSCVDTCDFNQLYLKPSFSGQHKLATVADFR